MLMRTDPFRELDRLTQQVFGTNGTLARPSVMPMDAWRDGDTFHVEFDLPGINPDSIDLDVERNVVTVKAERPPRASDAELIAAERPRGVFSRQLILGDNLDTEHISAALRQRRAHFADPGRRDRPSRARSPSPARARTVTPSTPDPAGEPSCPPHPATRSRAPVDREEFLDLVYGDEDLVDAEFDAIIAAEWPDRHRRTRPGTASPTGPPPLGPRGVRPVRGGGAAVAATSPRHRRMGRSALTPAVTRTQTTRKAGDRHT